jgi:hypothetical protein
MRCLQFCEITVARANLGLPVECDTLAVAKAVYDRQSRAIVSAGVVPNINDYAVQIAEVLGNGVKGSRQAPLFDVFQFQNPDIAVGLRPTILENPGLGFLEVPEAVCHEGYSGGFEQLTDFPTCEFPPKSWLCLSAK